MPREEISRPSAINARETSAMLTRAVQIVVLVLAVRRSLPSFITWISCSFPALIFGETSVIFRRTLSAIC
ncbi:hypothetical protein D3C87_1162100 [compost metagenome]